ncbi:sucrose-6-phosphate hydrolase [Rossellomorea aquimaris]|uniref:Sucrose-6-phosphate hydrolase n=1 Tax=Rossellomorea aquimaris TaxID=189382 RepID=A0A366EUY8_9BACI|nr:sucrose-6-phosphate hydrolase [Rossellomorea aquimaris]RBP05309.1 beta-fructofuranosidase [Rossellomorea aquimaris]
MNRDEQLRKEVYEEMEKHEGVVEQDPYRLHYHLMPPVGLLNDPNGFIQFKGVYHLYYQWMPFKTGHGAKFWGHYSSVDLVNWKHEEIALTPSEWFEKNGCYSGSAIEHDGKIYAYYTGNVKDEEGNRESYQCLALSEDSIHFDKKGPVVHLPEGFTAHFRDPKVWERDGAFFMVVGAQTTELKGAVVLLQSENLIDWEYRGTLTGGGRGKLADFGYMFECPDLFKLGDQDILIFSPQGIEGAGMKYQNVYQAGYVAGYFDSAAGTFEHGDFEELDRGFDFYAPQTTVDDKGRRILFAWMSVPDQNEQDHPTIEHKWLHTMTLPRELKLVNGKVRQVPLEELRHLRAGGAIEHKVELDKESRELTGVNGKAFELEIGDLSLSEGWFDLSIGDGVRLVYSTGEQVATLERKSYVNGVVEKRQCKVENLKSLRLFVDTSSIEVFINEGEETFTARFYPSPNNDTVRFGASNQAGFTIRKWDLNHVNLK